MASAVSIGDAEPSRTYRSARSAKLRVAEKLKEVAQPMLKNDYGRYLMSILDEKEDVLEKNLQY